MLTWILAWRHEGIRIFWNTTIRIINELINLINELINLINELISLIFHLTNQNFEPNWKFNYF